LVGEAVADFKGEHAEEVAEVKVDLPVDAHIPHDYIDGERLRLEAYRRIASAGDDAAIEEARAELTDRYGAPPTPVENLLAVASFRAYARQHGIREISSQGTSVRLAPVELPESAQLRLQRLYPRSVIKAAVRTILVPKPTTARIGGTPLRDTALLAWARELMDAVLGAPRKESL
ncbi:MAG: TRCF domain-containing protein, partial [Frankiaceae bacterium]